MKIKDNVSRPGRIWSIEVPARLGRRRLAGALESLPGLRLTHRPTLLGALRGGSVCAFEFLGRRYVVEPTWPAGDAFHISPDPPACEPGLLLIREALLSHPAFMAADRTGPA